MNKESLQELIDNSGDIAETLIDQQQGAVYSFMDELEDYDIPISFEEANDLLENLHSEVTEGIIRWAKEKMK